MFTLKTRSWVVELSEDRPDSTVETEIQVTWIADVDEVTVLTVNARSDELEPWPQNDYLEELAVLFRWNDIPSRSYWMGHLLQVWQRGKPRWLHVGKAWLLGPDGQTIERLR